MKKNKYVNYIVTILVILLLITITVFAIKKLLNKPEEFKVESRITDVKEERKKDKSNYKTIGWIKVQGTKVDAPIIAYTNASTNPESYEVDKENFTWNNNPEEKHFNKVNIMGHNVLNLSTNPFIGKEYFTRFEDLMAFAYKEHLEKNQYIQYTIDGKDYIYRIVGVYFEDSIDLRIHSRKNYKEDELKEFIKSFKEKSLYDIDTSYDEHDNYISLITCTRIKPQNKSRNFVVVGREVRENERKIPAKFETTKYYDEIVKIMRGEDTNEEA